MRPGERRGDRDYILIRAAKILFFFNWVVVPLNNFKGQEAILHTKDIFFLYCG